MDLIYTSLTAGLLPAHPDIDPDSAICRFATGPLAVILSYHHTENNDPPKDEMPGKGAHRSLFPAFFHTNPAVFLRQTS